MGVIEIDKIGFMYKELGKKKIWTREYFDELMHMFDRALSRKHKIILIMELDDESPNSSGVEGS